MNKTLMMVAAILITGCSWNMKQAGAIDALVLDAVNQYPIVEETLRQDVGLFDGEEQVILIHLAHNIRDKLILTYNTQEGIYGAYHALRAEYIKAIYMVESKMPYMEPQAVVVIQKHIDTVRLIDSEIQILIKENKNREETMSSIVSVATVVIKLALAAGL
jgi:hypothetical protein